MKPLTNLQRALLKGYFVCQLAAQAAEPNRLQNLVDQAPPDNEVVIPVGVWKEPIIISKAVKLRGASAEQSVLEITADQPAVRITTTAAVVLEQLTIRWQRASSQRPTEPLAALTVRDTPLTLRSVQFVASGNNARCPSALMLLGVANATIEGCSFEGFDFPVQFLEGAQGRVVDCVVSKPGHAGITVGADSSVEVHRCIIGHSGFHAIRSTGGELIATENLVISNKNRGFYLGNKSASGRIQNNAIIANGSGISGFAQSQVDVAHNLISDSAFAGLDARDTCLLTVRSNIFLNNTRALVLFTDCGKNRNAFLSNLLWGNKTNAENVELSAVIHADPRLADVANGNFRHTGNSDFAGFGPQTHKTLMKLWSRWQSISRRDR